MDGEAAAATIEALVQMLINVSKEEISQIRGLEKEAGKLKKTLAMIQNFLDDAEKKLIADEAVKTWLKELEAVAFDADNVLDELNYHLLSKKVKANETEKKKGPSCFPSFNHCMRRRQMALRIKEINTSLESIRKMATELGLESKLASAPAAPDAAGLETNSLALDPIFIGRDDDVKKIVEMLKRSPIEQVLSVLPVVGMGGLGKTTLARKVFNDEKIKTQFGERIWLHVPKNYDPSSLLKEILTRLTSTKEEDGSSDEVILKKLQEALKSKTYLLVLDDVWDQDRLKWEGFMNSLSGITSLKGNGIIVTTRITEVASIVNTLAVHQLNGLSEPDCWSIIEQKAFAGRDVPSGIEIIGRNIAKKCQGLPLAANVVGGVLRNKSENEWHSIEEKWLSQGDENNISKILKLSFNHLSLPLLKKCFAYCSIFPKGKKINTQQLIELWMAEGFLQADQTNDMETVGDEFLKLLLQNSLLQVVKRDEFGNVMLCSMHDLVHDLASSVSNSIYQVRYISSENDGDESSSIPKEHAKCLRTLFLEGEISDIMFSDFRCLHVLKLDGSDVEELPHSIKELIHLRYISISYTEIEYLPDSIGELYLLQTLRAYYCLRKLPSTLKHLIRLRHLHVDDHVELPPNIGRLTSLQSLNYFHVGDEEGHRIGELGSLKNLKGEIHILNLEKVHGEEEAKNANLFQKPNIVKLVLRWNKSRGGETLEGLQPHPNLKSLEIFGFSGTKFPSWTLKMAVQDKNQWAGLNNLMELRLEDCKECEEIPMLGHLPHLNYLRLSNLRNVKSLGFSFYGIDKCRSIGGVSKETTIVFRALKRLELQYMSSLIEWVEVSAAESQPHEVKVFPCLEYLKIDYCQKLRSAPSEFPCLKELDIETMDSGLPLANICGIKLISLTKLKIKGLDGLECLSNWLFYNNQNLSELRIISCPKLRELPDGLHTLNSLEELTIELCPNLKSIPYSSGGQSQGLTSLRRLIIQHCDQLINLSDLHTLNSLKELEIKWCPNLELIPYSSGGQSQGLTSLRRLIIQYCEGLIDLPALHILSSLEELEIKGCPNLESISYSSGGQSQGLTLLRRLEICDCEELINLPDLRYLNSLEELMIGECPNLESIPYSSGGQSQGLTSLRMLLINDCEELINLPCEMLGSCAPSLECLLLKNLSSLVNLPMIIDCLHKMPRLTYLIIVGVPNFTTSSSTEIGAFPSLQQLNVGPASLDSVDCADSFKKAVGGILRLGSQSLRELELTGMEDWDSSSLPDELQHLTALNELKLDNFGIEELPEWFGNFTALERLYLLNCEKLRRLPSLEAMRRLIKLSDLYIQGCPVLEERCIKQPSDDDDDSEWPKISHIPFIEVDWTEIRRDGRTEEAYRYLDGARQR